MTIFVLDSDGNAVENETCDTSSSSVTCSLTAGSLSGGSTYDVNATAYDEVGNKGTDTSMGFTVDTSYDGDTSPSISVEDEDNGVVNFDENKEMYVDFDSADSESDTTATCFVEDEEVGSDSFGSADSGDDEVTCDIDLDEDMDYYDTEAEVYVEMEDEAGNSETSDSENIAFDVNAPYVSMDSVAGVSAFNDNFDMSLDVSDSATSAEYIEYFFDDASTSYEDGTDISDFDSGEFEVDASGLDTGNHTLYVRAEDEAGHWSDPESFDFEYLPDQDPEVSLSVPENVSVEAGSSDSFEVELENTGEFFIEELPVDVSSDIYSESDSVADFEPGVSVTLTFDVSPAEEDIGKYDLEVSSDEPSTSESFELLVEANEDQKEDINSTFQNYSQKLESLQENVTALKSNGLSEERNQRLDSNFSSFKDKVEEAESAVESGDYYKADEVLSSIEEDYTSAQQTYSTVKEEEKKAQTRQTILMVLLGLFVIVSVCIGYVAYSDRYDLDLEAIEGKLQEFDLGSGGEEDNYAGTSEEGGSIVESIRKKLSALSDSATGTDAEDYGWEGFEDK